MVKITSPTESARQVLHRTHQTKAQRRKVKAKSLAINVPKRSLLYELYQTKDGSKKHVAVLANFMLMTDASMQKLVSPERIQQIPYI